MNETIDAYVGVFPEPIADEKQAAMAAALDDTFLLCLNTSVGGDAWYYRIHGPRVFIEFSHMNPNATHVHSVLRDPEDDYGEMTLAGSAAWLPEPPTQLTPAGVGRTLWELSKPSP